MASVEDLEAQSIQYHAFGFFLSPYFGTLGTLGGRVGFKFT
jgi:hypothetical protein